MRAIIILACLLSFSSQMQGSINTRLNLIQEFAKKSESDAIYILRDGKPLYKYSSHAPTAHFDVMEIRDSIFALGVIKLLDTGAITSLETPLKYFIPDSQFGHFTIGNLLNGSLDCIHPEGSVALMKVIEKVSSKPVENYLLDNVFLPLGITDIYWRTTMNESVPHLYLTAADLARIGYFMSCKGLWNGQQLISEKFLQLLTLPGQLDNPFLGLQWQLELYDCECWWDDSLIEMYKESGFAAIVTDRLQELQGRVLRCSGQCFGKYYVHFPNEDMLDAFGSEPDAEKFIADIQRKELPLARFRPGAVKSISAIGQGGQQMVICSNHNLVAVRQKRTPSTHNFDSFNREFTLLINIIGKPSDYPIE